MKILILHGDNQVESRKRLNDLIEQSKQGGLNIVKVNGAKVKKAELLTLVKSQNLLGATDLLVIEGFFANKKAQELFELLINQQTDITNSCLFWEGRSLPVSKIPSRSFIKVESFQRPRAVFKILELITPETKKQALILMQDKQVRDEAEFFFIMLAHHVRNLVWVKEESESVPFPAWKKGKLRLQAGKFKGNSLRKLQTHLLELDYQMKTSKLPENLIASLDILVASI